MSANVLTTNSAGSAGSSDDSVESLSNKNSNSQSDQESSGDDDHDQYNLTDTHINNKRIIRNILIVLSFIIILQLFFFGIIRYSFMLGASILITGFSFCNFDVVVLSSFRNNDNSSLEGEGIRNLLNFTRTSIVSTIFVVFLCISSFLMYCYCVNVEDDGSGVRGNVIYMIVLIPLSLLCLSVALNVTIFWKSFTICSKLCLFVLIMICLYAIFIVDQRTAEDNNMPFGFGYYSSRVFILFFIVLSLTMFFVILMMKVNARIRVLFCCVISVVFVSITIFLLFRYFHRRKIFNDGIYGTFRPEESKCRVTNDVFLITPLIPKFLVHVILQTYWCSKENEFTKIILSKNDDDSKLTQIEVECDPDKTEIILIPKPETLTFDEMKWDENLYGGRTYLQESLFRKREIIRLSNKDVNVVRKKSSFEYTYDGLKYETSMVKCYEDEERTKVKSKNLIVNPRKKFEDDELLDASLENPNIISILVDSSGRKNLEHDLSSSFGFLRELDRGDQFDAYEFYNLHSIRLFTIPTTLAAFTGFYGGIDSPGQYREEGGPDPIPIWMFEREAPNLGQGQGGPSRGSGKKRRLTAFSADTCEEWSSWLGVSDSYYSDYIHLEPFCFVEFFEPKQRFMAFKGPYCPARKCLFQFEAPQLPFDYLVKLEALYPGKSKLLNVHLMDSHEKSSQSLQYVDSYLLNYLKFLHEKNILENSILFIWSDHGNHESFTQDLSSGGMKFLASEQNLVWNPGLHILVPSKYHNEEQRMILRTNQHRLTTHYDLHKTWWNILKLNESESEIFRESQRNVFGKDLFHEEIPKDRKVEDCGIVDERRLVGDCMNLKSE